MTRNWNSSAPDKGEIEGTFTYAKNSGQRELSKVGGKFAAYLGDEAVGTRTSKTRNYTHAVVVQWSEKDSRDYARNYDGTSTDEENYEYYETLAALPTSGGTYRRYNNRSKSVYVYPVGAQDVQKGRDMLTKFPTFAHYVEGRRNSLIKAHEKKVSEGYFKPFAWSWHQRKELAQAEAAKMQSRSDTQEVWVVKVMRH